MTDTKTREELNALSKEVFGASSRWQKLVSKGYTELLTEEVTEHVPNAEDETKEGTTRKVQVPVKASGMHQYVTKHHTIESIRTYMLERKAAIEAIQAQIKKQQEENKAKQEQLALAKKVQEEASGSAV